MKQWIWVKMNGDDSFWLLPLILLGWGGSRSMIIGRRWGLEPTVRSLRVCWLVKLVVHLRLRLASDARVHFQMDCHVTCVENACYFFLLAVWLSHGWWLPAKAGRYLWATLPLDTTTTGVAYASCHSRYKPLDWSRSLLPHYLTFEPGIICKEYF